ncbi:MAG TPA: hypothetical protein VIF15_10060 [Polyangiaceae bacterium]
MKRVAAALAVAAGTTLATLATPARAVEREHHLGLDAGAAMLVVHDKSTPDVGGVAGLHYTYGLNDQFNLLVEATWSLVALGETLQDPSTPRTRPSNVTSGGVGLGYVLDVLRWVPWGGVLLGGYALEGGTIDGVKVLPGAAIALGLDYRFDRSWVAGVSVRQHMLVTDMTDYPSFTQAFARFEYTWGW